MKNCTYFVEGECEKKLLNALKASPNLILPGKVRVFNVIQDVLTGSHLYSIKEGYVVFVFDSDVKTVEKLKQNIEKVRKYCPQKTVTLLFLVQLKKLEDELVRATDVNKIEELTGSRSEKDFKSDFLALKDLRLVLNKHGFKIEKLWTQPVPEPFNFVEQGTERIVLCNNRI